MSSQKQIIDGGGEREHHEKNEINGLVLKRTPAFMGRIADVHSMHIGMVVPLVCFVFIALYGLYWQKLEAKDAVKNGVPS